jgi:DnaJ-class molecular chaperone
MSFRVAEPPVDPPEVRMVECATCEGLGVLRDIEHGVVTFEAECYRCEGLGEVEYDPDDNPYAPDTWKEAEGIA